MKRFLLLVAISAVCLFAVPGAALSAPVVNSDYPAAQLPDGNVYVFDDSVGAYREVPDSATAEWLGLQWCDTEWCGISHQFNNDYELPGGFSGDFWSMDQ